MTTDYVDHRQDPAAWARALGVSTEAVEVYLAGDVIDLHIDSFLWSRMLGYDLAARHGPGIVPGAFAWQVDIPRVREACITGGTWIITTNPARSSEGRAQTFARNLARIQKELAQRPDDVAVVRNVAEYRAARAEGKHGAFLGIQGGNALDHVEDGSALDLIPDQLILRVTLVHLSTSSLGVTSSPLSLGDADGLTRRGKDYVRALNHRKIFVDLAHISRKGFFDALEVHDRTQPVMVTHTGVSGVTPHWRNLDDEQLRAVADLGGTVGIIFHAPFLGDPLWGGRASSIVRHLEHVVNVIGDDHASLGSDWDGMIVTPRDMPTCLELPRLVQAMLDRAWSHERIHKVLGGNFLRTVAALRG